MNTYNKNFQKPPNSKAPIFNGDEFPCQETNLNEIGKLYQEESSNIHPSIFFYLWPGHQLCSQNYTRSLLMATKNPLVVVELAKGHLTRY